MAKKTVPPKGKVELAEELTLLSLKKLPVTLKKRKGVYRAFFVNPGDMLRGDKWGVFLQARGYYKQTGGKEYEGYGPVVVYGQRFMLVNEGVPGWSMIEQRSGCRMTSGGYPTPQEAYDAFWQMFVYITKDRLIDRIVEQIEGAKHGVQIRAVELFTFGVI